MVLPRVPYRSLCRFRCVSRSWRALCSDRRVLRRSPQTLSGFFCHSRDARRRGSVCHSRDGHLLVFRNLSGRGRPLIDPCLPFLRQRGYRSVTLIHCCNGILLCSAHRERPPSPAEYIVCNPATEEIWAVLPVPASHGDQRDSNICLCFDPAIVPSYFAVFVKPSESGGVEVYSSETGRWASLLSECGHLGFAGDDLGYVFFNGTLHLSAYYSSLIVTLDTKRQTWGEIPMPEDNKPAAIGLSQGRLHLVCIDYDNDWQLSVWVLEEYASGQWTLKHTADFPGLLGTPRRIPTEIYQSVAIHPECNLVFFIGGEERSWSLMSYDMDTRKVQHISSLESRRYLPCLPYVPCFVKWSSDGH
ncbi:F-box protein At5g49610-like [Aegilops tauschii subsp. strangulata]|uniref:F-box protein At5g49610-like n=1 Tax=Aegilops tauschii subsp. strangulata TaxID=200361 RepID=UPI003CC86BED